MAAGSGLTAAADSSLTKTIVGVTSGAYATPANNYVAYYTTQFTAAAKAGATEWLTSSNPSYARQPMGATGAGWTINAYSSGVGVLWTNSGTITQPAVSTNAQTLFALGFCDALTGGNIDFFADLASSQPVAVGVQVIIAPYTGSGTGAAFTTY